MFFHCAIEQNYTSISAPWKKKKYINKNIMYTKHNSRTYIQVTEYTIWS